MYSAKTASTYPRQRTWVNAGPALGTLTGGARGQLAGSRGVNAFVFFLLVDARRNKGRGAAPTRLAGGSGHRSGLATYGRAQGDEPHPFPVVESAEGHWKGQGRGHGGGGLRALANLQQEATRGGREVLG